MDMEYEQLVKAKDTQKANGNTTATIKYLEQLLKLSTDITLIAQHLLELADALFDDKQFQKSACRNFSRRQPCPQLRGQQLL